MHVNIDQLDLTLEYMKNGRGVIYALPHMGDFEQAGRWIIRLGAGSFTTVAERLKPEAVFQRFLEFRQGLGMEVLPTTGGPHPFGVMAQRLRAGSWSASWPTGTCPTPGSRWTSSARRRCSRPGPAALAVQTGAALMPVACWFDGEDEWGAHIYDEIPVPADGTRKQKAAVMTQAMATVFEEAIREHPEDWHMLQKVFVSDLDPERLARSRDRARATQRPAAAPRRGTDAEPPQPARRDLRASMQPRHRHSDPPPRDAPPGRRVSHADRHRVPVLVGRPRRGPAAHQGPGRGADRAAATRSR